MMELSLLSVRVPFEEYNGTCELEVTADGKCSRLEGMLSHQHVYFHFTLHCPLRVLVHFQISFPEYGVAYSGSLPLQEGSDLGTVALFNQYEQLGVELLYRLENAKRIDSQLQLTVGRFSPTTHTKGMAYLRVVNGASPIFTKPVPLGLEVVRWDEKVSVSRARGKLVFIEVWISHLPQQMLGWVLVDLDEVEQSGQGLLLELEGLSGELEGDLWVQLRRVEKPSALFIKLGRCRMFQPQQVAFRVSQISNTVKYIADIEPTKLTQSLLDLKRQVQTSLPGHCEIKIQLVSRKGMEVLSQRILRVDYLLQSRGQRLKLQFGRGRTQLCQLEIQVNSHLKLIESRASIQSQVNQFVQLKEQPDQEDEKKASSTQCLRVSQVSKESFYYQKGKAQQLAPILQQPQASFESLKLSRVLYQQNQSVLIEESPQASVQRQFIQALSLPSKNCLEQLKSPRIEITEPAERINVQSGRILAYKQQRKDEPARMVFTKHPIQEQPDSIKKPIEPTNQIHNSMFMRKATAEVEQQQPSLNRKRLKPIVLQGSKLAEAASFKTEVVVAKPTSRFKLIKLNKAQVQSQQKKTYKSVELPPIKRETAVKPESVKTEVQRLELSRQHSEQSKQVESMRRTRTKVHLVKYQPLAKSLAPSLVSSIRQGLRQLHESCGQDPIYELGRLLAGKRSF